jgi:voltage-gated potassium channel
VADREVRPESGRLIAFERRFEPVLIAAAILTVPAVALDFEELDSPAREIAAGLNWTIWLIFVTEVVVGLALTYDRKRWLKSHPLDLAIVILSPPIVPAALQSTRALRLLRLLRLVWAGAIFKRVLAPEGLGWTAAIVVLVTLGAGAAFGLIEPHRSEWDGIWWAVTTVTTVGYGDISPTTDAGRVIGIILMTTGIGFVALLTASVAQRFIRQRQHLDELADDLAAVRERLDRIEHHLAVIAERGRTSADRTGADFPGRPR